MKILQEKKPLKKESSDDSKTKAINNKVINAYKNNGKDPNSNVGKKLRHPLITFHLFLKA